MEKLLKKRENMFTQKNLLAKAAADKQSEIIWNKLIFNLNPAYHKLQLLKKKHPIALLIWVHLLQDKRNPQRFYLCEDNHEESSNDLSEDSWLNGFFDHVGLNSALENSSFSAEENYDVKGRKIIKLCIFRLQWKNSSICRSCDEEHQQVVRIIKEGWHVTHFSRNQLKSQELVLKIAETQAQQALEEALYGFPLSEILLMSLAEFASLSNKFFDELVHDLHKKEMNTNDKTKINFVPKKLFDELMHNLYKEK